MEIVLKISKHPSLSFLSPFSFLFFPLSCSFVGLFLHLDPCLVFRVRMWGGRDLGFPEGIGVVLWGLRDTEVTATSLEPYVYQHLSFRCLCLVPFCAFGKTPTLKSSLGWILRTKGVCSEERLCEFPSSHRELTVQGLDVCRST